MEVIDSGHKYKLSVLDNVIKTICAGCGKEDCDSCPSGTLTSIPVEQYLQFVKRNNPPENYPGNDRAYPGTTIQEVCRALIDRCKYVNNQEYCSETEVCITYFRRVIIELETRAAKRHNRKEKLQLQHDIENMPTCRNCGHIGCDGTCRSESLEKESLAV